MLFVTGHTRSTALVHTCSVCSFMDVDKNCSFFINRVSGILLASGVPEEIAAGTIRLSVGRHTTLRDVDVAVDELKHAVDEILCANANTAAPTDASN